ncbi:MAG: hypothetical protein R2757_03325 [Draconibacterium sp.]
MDFRGGFNTVIYFPEAIQVFPANVSKCRIVVSEPAPVPEYYWLKLILDCGDWDIKRVASG